MPLKWLGWKLFGGGGQLLGVPQCGGPWEGPGPPGIMWGGMPGPIPGPELIGPPGPLLDIPPLAMLDGGRGGPQGPGVEDPEFPAGLPTKPP